MSTKATYLGVGKVYLDGVFVGNVSKLEISVEEDRQTVRDFTQPGGGEYDSVSRVSGVGLALTQWDISIANLQRALRGASSSLTSSSVTSEDTTAALDKLVQLARVPDPGASLTITDSTATTTYVEGTDYTRTTSGYIALSTGSITDAEALKASYSALAGDVLEALTTSAAKYELVFEGLNEADNDLPVIVTVYKASFGPLATLPLIGDAFASIDVTGRALADTSITTSGKSQYFKVQRTTSS